MIDERTDECIGIMATTTIRACVYVAGHYGWLAGRVNTIAIIVA